MCDGSQAHRREGLLHEGHLALLDLRLRSLLLRRHVSIQLRLDLRGLRLPCRGGCGDLRLNGLRRLLLVSLDGLRGLLARLAELGRVHHLHLVGLAQHVRGLRQGLQQLLVAVVDLRRHGAVPERIQHRHHGQEGDGNEGQRQAEVEHAAGMRRLWRCRQQQGAACHLPRLNRGACSAGVPRFQTLGCGEGAAARGQQCQGADEQQSSSESG
mmetsp:Transcript_29016/g.77513  ORF Transcript_29016/g.77513 Transcript_29016/m.77513 type:complete len:212 (-) Transcript_29016:70-705(-)